MLSSVLVTFEESEELYVRTVLREIRQNLSTEVKRIAIGQLFDKKAASIFLPENQLQNVFDKLIANELNIFPFNDEYKEKIKQTKEKVKESNLFQQDKIRAQYFQKRRKEILSERAASSAKNSGVRKSQPPVKPKELPAEIKTALKSIEKGNPAGESVDIHVKEGNYVLLRNMIKNNPLHNEHIKEKYIPAIKNSIKIHLEKGSRNSSYVDTAIVKLKEIICDVEIKAIKTEDIIDLAGNALISLCTQTDPEKLVEFINLPNVGQRINVMSAVKLSELIHEKEGTVDTALLEYAAAKINKRFLLTAYDVMEPVISEINRARFNLLMNSIEEFST
ncbi:MAG: hypothetical protein FD122_2357 [Stygiobacter sp.]|nr:MAG: hypothetical protein FD122_2357 [Stygiobacter sp.]KAF0211404.1 MAG: hypothetical protein FD178_3441 [Ignavibacteria bacterium]